MLIFDKKILRKRSVEWTGTEEDLDKLVDDMGSTMEEHNGIGISAIQIGVPARVFIAEMELFVNPKVVNRSPYMKKHWESCLSCPNTTVITSRAAKITLKYDTIREGKWQNVEKIFTDWKLKKVSNTIHNMDYNIQRTTTTATATKHKRTTKGGGVKA